jgi:hypothetical protein
MSKKIKSFNVDEEVYDSLNQYFKKYKSSESVSSFLEHCIRDLLEYLQTMEEGLNGSDSFDKIMKNVIDKTVSQGVISKPSWLYSDDRYGRNILEGEPIIQAGMELISLEDGKTPEEIKETMEELREEEEEECKEKDIRYWKDDFEAQEKGLPRSFIKFLNSGEFNLSKNRLYLIEKETGDRYMDYGGVRIVKVSKDLILK